MPQTNLATIPAGVVWGVAGYVGGPVGACYASLAILGALIVWNNGLRGALLRAGEKTNFRPWCGAAEYVRRVRPVLFAAGAFFALWTFGSVVLGL